MNNHPFHLVDKSPWPLVGSIGLLTMMSGMIMWFHQFNMILMTLGSFIVILTMIQWWRDVVRESTFQGLHTSTVMVSMKVGMILFITSEVLFFFSFFWAFFHSSLSPSIELGLIWPPVGILSFNPINIPMLNTMVLLSSGVSITWAHNSLINNNYTQTMHGLLVTVILGFYFTLLQLFEYIESPFCISDSVYGSTFFLTTGFHGLHVIIGTIFIYVSFIRVKNLHFHKDHHLGFEASAWYWHFVDVVWLFLYISIYWWGK
uniref:Cytochrome c oxidase subunit 3 n=3 Tax=Empoascini TaxID=562036 RepID=A0A077D626_EMPVT|nr:cytochrome c oxidase subunit III [Empoasca vitis]YP_009469871.1 cytochrome c oxidase subunit III [Matsumurasca onukii]QFO89460.1 cytochrome c oxidase subunit 3 [Empoasca flavescens]AIL29203.1 cytochrome c oxidase subunit III [Empoasca vitis]AVF91594.1 cytochrome c oxidase subunit III [Matsumurasca onukii]UGK73339.1 cytochrome c oxidase subunit III [Empoasca vitis]